MIVVRYMSAIELVCNSVYVVVVYDDDVCFLTCNFKLKKYKYIFDLIYVVFFACVPIWGIGCNREH